MPAPSISLSEENYLKAIFKLSEKSSERISTNAIAHQIGASPASVTDMMRKLADKGFISYEKYKGVKLKKAGEKHAKQLLRRHRLWEVFLMEKLSFNWDEVHDIAEDLEHIGHAKLVDRLEEFLDHPRFDPHGDPIPDKDGNIVYHEDISLDQLAAGEEGIIVAVNEHSSAFLRYLDKSGLVLQARVQVIEQEEFDNSRVVQCGGREIMISEKVCKNLLIRRVKP